MKPFFLSRVKVMVKKLQTLTMDEIDDVEALIHGAMGGDGGDSLII